MHKRNLANACNGWRHRCHTLTKPKKPTAKLFFILRRCLYYIMQIYIFLFEKNIFIRKNATFCKKRYLQLLIQP